MTCGPRRGTQQPDEDRMRGAGRRTQLRLVQRPQEEWMIDAFDRPHTSVRLDSCDAQAVGGRQVREVGRQSVVTGGELVHLPFAVQLGKPRAGRQIDGDLLSVQRAREQRDDRSSALAILVVNGITDAGKVTGMFYQNMLEAPSRADQWHAALAGSANGGQDRLRVAIRASGSDDNRRIGLDCAWIRERVGWGDQYVGAERQGIGRVLDRRQGGNVVRMRRG